MNYSQQQLHFSSFKDKVLYNSKDNINNPKFSSSKREDKINPQFLDNIQNKEILNEIELNIILNRSESNSTLELMKIYIEKNKNIQSNLLIKITNPNDGLFLYILELSEIEYQQLQIEQELLVDFQHFPNYILKLLNQCKNDTEDKFNCILDINQVEENISNLTSPGILTIEEKTEYKKNIHLILKLQPANDIYLKNYLNNIYKEYKDKYESLLVENNELNKNFEDLQIEIIY